MSECPACGSEEWSIVDRVCEDCGHYDESYHHGSEAKRLEQQRREMEKRFYDG